MANSSWGRFMPALFALILLVCSVVQGRHFRAHDSVPIIANTIGPFNNPTETYPVSLSIVMIPINHFQLLNTFFGLHTVLFSSILHSHWTSSPAQVGPRRNVIWIT